MNESNVKRGTLELLRSLGYECRLGAEIAPDHPSAERTSYDQVILSGRLRGAVAKLNPQLSAGECDQVVRVATKPPHPMLQRNNRWFHNLLINGIDVEYKDQSTCETRGGRARLVDFADPASNDFLATVQLVVKGPSGGVIRPDLTIFLNGLPIAVIELKDPSDTQADLGMAINQLGRYLRTAPELFIPNLMLVASDGLLTRIDHRRAQPVYALAAARGRDTDAGGIGSRVTGIKLLTRLPACVRRFRGGWKTQWCGTPTKQSPRPR